MLFCSFPVSVSADLILSLFWLSKLEKQYISLSAYIFSKRKKMFTSVSLCQSGRYLGVMLVCVTVDNIAKTSVG